MKNIKQNLLFELAMSELPIYQRALKFADFIHRNQGRKYNPNDKYMVHPIAVSLILDQWGYNENYQAIAILHDTIEDATNVSATINLIKKYFGDKILSIIKLLSHDKSESYNKYLLDLAKTNKEAFIVKMADMWNNLHDNPSKKQTLKYANAIKYLADNGIKITPDKIVKYLSPYFEQVAEIRKQISENRKRK